jgi:hypothetical protein
MVIFSMIQISVIVFQRVKPRALKSIFVNSELYHWSYAYLEDREATKN